MDRKTKSASGKSKIKIMLMNSVADGWPDRVISQPCNITRHYNYWLSGHLAMLICPKEKNEQGEKDKTLT